MLIVFVHSELSFGNRSKYDNSFLSLGSIEVLIEQSVGYVLEAEHTNEMKDFILLIQFLY